VDVVEGVLTIYPSHRDRRGSWTSKGINKEHHVAVIPMRSAQRFVWPWNVARERCSRRVGCVAGQSVSPAHPICLKAMSNQIMIRSVQIG